jgi:DnaJ domain
MRDPYEILGLPRTATTGDINRSFRRLAKELHPDANTGDPEAVARFTELSRAYEILGDWDKRKAFDRGDIDATGAPVAQRSLQIRLRRPAAATRQSVAWLLVGSMLGATAAVVIQSQMPQRQINANSGGKSDALRELQTREQPAPTTQVEPQSVRPEQGEPQPAREAQSNEYPAPPAPADQAAGPQREGRLVVEQTVFSTALDEIPLGVEVIGGGVGLALEIAGFAPELTISAGRPLGMGRWRLLASELGTAVIRVPAEFRGTVDFDVELRRPDDTVVDRRSLHRLGPAQIALLIKRSRELISEGDVAAARPSLQRAAEARDVGAALALGATYDPIMLSTLQAPGLAADVALARGWYAKASELGSQEAQQRLDMLVVFGR